MDKREEKTIKKIHDAFTILIAQKDYDDIVIEDILLIANISRSTFYAHYKTKDELLISVSNHIFEHVFSHSLQEEATHDYSKDTFYDYHHLIEHIFYHVQDEKELFKGILKNNSNEVFLAEFRKHIYHLVNSYYNNYPNSNSSTPLELKKAIGVEGFITILKYWINTDFKDSPEDIAKYYFNNVLAI